MPKLAAVYDLVPECVASGDGARAGTKADVEDSGGARTGTGCWILIAVAFINQLSPI